MKLLELLTSKFKRTKSADTTDYKPREAYVDPNIVYLFTVEVPSKHYQVDIYENTKMEALYETMRIMQLTEIPEDIQITKSGIPKSSIYKHWFWFRNKESYIKPINYRYYYDTSLVVNE